VLAEASESVTSIRHLIRAARRHGLVLDEGPTAGLPAFSSRVSPHHAHGLWERAVRVLGPTLPLIVATSPDEHTSLLYFAAMACRTIGETLQLIVERWGYVTDAFPVTTLRCGDAVHLCLEVGAPVPLGARLGVEYLLATLVRAGGQLTGGDWRPTEIVLGHHPPAGLEAWEAASGTPVRVDAGSPRLVIAPDSLALPVRDGISRAAGRFFLELLDWYTPRRRAAASVAERVTEALGRNLGAVAPTVEQVAAELALSARSLHRQLAAEGTSYQRLLDTVRCDEAIRQTLEEQRPLKAIAAAVGFADPRAFRRAFKRWTGTTPHEFRLRRLGERGLGR
jgi:AraC-like DNA-binding protein